VLDDIEGRRNDAAFLDALGARKIPDPTTSSDYCRRFDADDIGRLMATINEVRVDVWSLQGAKFTSDTARIDVDGSMVAATGECKEGMDISRKGVWGYHPLLVSLANTRAPLFLINRSANRPSHEGAPAVLDQAIELSALPGSTEKLSGDLTGHLFWSSSGPASVNRLALAPQAERTAGREQDGAPRPLFWPAWAAVPHLALVPARRQRLRPGGRGTRTPYGRGSIESMDRVDWPGEEGGIWVKMGAEKIVGEPDATSSTDTALPVKRRGGCLKWVGRSVAVGLVLSVGLLAGVAIDRAWLTRFVPLAEMPPSARSDFQLMAEAWNTIGRQYVDRSSIQPRSMTYGAITGMVFALGDTGHSTFLSPSMRRVASEVEQGKLLGIGIEIWMRNGHVEVVAPLDHSPAERAGLRPSDVILEVDGHDLTGQPLSEIVGRIAGPPGTKVTLRDRTTYANRSDSARPMSLAREQASKVSSMHD
jgi:hypothetical protein